MRADAVSAGLETLLFDAPAMRASDGALAVSAAVFTYRCEARAGELESALVRLVRPAPADDAALATPRARACGSWPPSPPQARPPVQAMPVFLRREVWTRKATDGSLRSYLLVHACTKHPHFSVHMRVGHGVDDSSIALALGNRMIHIVSKDSRRSTYGIWSFYSLRIHQAAQVGDSRSSYMCTSSSRYSDTSGRSTFTTTTTHGRTYSRLITHYLRLCLAHDGDHDEDGLHLLVRTDRRRYGVNEEHSVRCIRAAMLNVYADTTRP
jgi:hypothetical protein